jgi:uncharacterized protein YndB with AHSA1/START domain
MRGIFLAPFAALLFAVPASAGTIQIENESFRDAGGHRVQQLSAVVNAPLAEVWKAFTTDDGFERWAVPVTHITLGNDGMMESSYNLGDKIGVTDDIKNRIVAYLPEKLLVLQNAHVPKGGPFDPVLIANLRTIITFAPIDATHTRVTEAQVGYGEGNGYDDMYKHFLDGNAYELHALADSFISGPVDWKKEAAAEADASVHK